MSWSHQQLFPNNDLVKKLTSHMLQVVMQHVPGFVCSRIAPDGNLRLTCAQALHVHGSQKGGYDVTAVACMLMSQAPTLQSLRLDISALPERRVGDLASLQSLTSLTVRICMDSVTWAYVTLSLTTRHITETAD